MALAVTCWPQRQDVDQSGLSALEMAIDLYGILAFIMCGMIAAFLINGVAISRSVHVCCSGLRWPLAAGRGALDTLHGRVEWIEALLAV